MSAKLRNKLQEAKRNFDSNARKSLDFNLKAAEKTDSEQNEAVKKDEMERVADLLRQNNVISVIKFQLQSQIEIVHIHLFLIFTNLPTPKYDKLIKTFIRY